MDNTNYSAKYDKTDTTKNLVSLATRTTEEQREIAKKGGIASGEARREKKLLKEEILKKMSDKDWDDMIINLISKAKENTKDFEVLRDTIGQKPSTDVNINTDAEEFEFKYKYSK